MSQKMYYAMVAEFQDQDMKRVAQEVYAFPDTDPRDFIEIINEDLKGTGLTAYVTVAWESHLEETIDEIADFMADLCSDFWLSEKDPCCSKMKFSNPKLKSFRRVK